MIICQSAIVSDQVLFDIPHVEHVMFRIKFTYLKTVDVTCDFWFSRAIHLCCVFSILCKLDLAKYRDFNTQFDHSTNVIPVTGLSNTLTVMMLAVPRHWEGMRGLKLLFSSEFFC